MDSSGAAPKASKGKGKGPPPPKAVCEPGEWVKAWVPAKKWLAKIRELRVGRCFLVFKFWYMLYICIRLHTLYIYILFSLSLWYIFYPRESPKPTSHCQGGFVGMPEEVKAKLKAPRFVDGKLISYILYKYVSSLKYSNEVLILNLHLSFLFFFGGDLALVVIDNLHKPTRHAKTVGIVIYQLGLIPSNNITLCRHNGIQKTATRRLRRHRKRLLRLEACQLSSMWGHLENLLQLLDGCWLKW